MWSRDRRLSPPGDPLVSTGDNAETSTAEPGEELEGELAERLFEEVEALELPGSCTEDLVDSHLVLLDVDSERVGEFAATSLGISTGSLLAVWAEDLPELELFPEPATGGDECTDLQFLLPEEGDRLVEPCEDVATAHRLDSDTLASPYLEDALAGEALTAASSEHFVPDLTAPGERTATGEFEYFIRVSGELRTDTDEHTVYLEEG